MGQEADKKWTAAVNLQPTLPKPDRLLATQIDSCSRTANTCAFTADAVVQPTDSVAEQALRSSVLKRKISSSSRTGVRQRTDGSSTADMILISNE